MPCYQPRLAYLPLDGGKLSFHEIKDSRSIRIACKQCIGCRLMRQNAWTVRMLCEAQMHPENWFITWTYADEHLPLHGSLDYSDVQSCNRKLRKTFGKFRFFVAGEYGDTFGRAHWHSVNFGLHISDLDIVKMSGDRPIYRSKLLEKAWGKGNVFIGTVTPQSVRYCASYTLKKITGARADEHYRRLDPSTGELVFVAPEMARMSLKPGLGASWFAKYWQDCVTHKAVVGVGGKKQRLPRFFNERIDAWDNDALVASIQAEFFASAEAHRKATERDNTPERLAIREQCALARVAFYGAQ